MIEPSNSLETQVREKLSANYHALFVPFIGSDIESMILASFGENVGIVPTNLEQVIDADLTKRKWAIEEGTKNGWDASEVISFSDNMRNFAVNLNRGLPISHSAESKVEEALDSFGISRVRHIDSLESRAQPFMDFCNHLGWEIPLTAKDVLLRIESELEPEIFANCIERFRDTYEELSAEERSTKNLRDYALEITSHWKLKEYLKDI